MAKTDFSIYLKELCLLPKDVPRVKVFTGKSGKAGKKKMGKFSLSHMVRRIFSSGSH